MSTEPEAQDERTLQLWKLRKALGERLSDIYEEEMSKRHSAAYMPPAEQWGALRERLSRTIVADDALLDRLALLGIAHQHQGQRVLLAGPTGAGKTWTATKWAEALALPVIVIAVNELTEPGFAGSHLQDHLEKWVDSSLGGCAAGVIVLDEIDKLSPGDGHGNGREHFLKMQGMLLPLLGRNSVVAGEGKSLGTHGISVVCCGAFSTAEWSQEGRVPTSEELIEYGLIPELVDRLEERITLPAMDAARLVEVWGRELGSAFGALDMLATSLGYDLTIDETCYAYVAQAVMSGRGGTGPRTARSLIEQAAKGVLTEALRSKTPPGSHLRVSPDDVQIPRAVPPRRS